MQRLFLNAWDLSSIENYVRVIVFAPDLRRASFYDKTGLLFHSTTIKLVPRPKLIMTPTRSSKSHSNARSLYHPCGCRGADLYAMSQCLSVPPIKEADGRNNSAHPAESLRVYFILVRCPDPGLWLVNCGCASSWPGCSCPILEDSRIQVAITNCYKGTYSP